MATKKPRWFTLRSKKGPDREIAETQKRIQERPGDPRLHQRLAELYLERGGKDEAIAEFIRAAECHSGAGFYLRAIALYRRILRMKESTDILMRLAELYLLNGLLGDALVQFRKIIEEYRKQGKSRQILKVLKRMPEVDPGNLEIRTKYIELLRSEGFLLQAFDELVGLYRENQDKASPGSLQEWGEEIQSLHKVLKEQFERQGNETGLSRLAEEMAGLLEQRDLPAETEAPEEEEVALNGEIADDVEAVETIREAREEILIEQGNESQLEEPGLSLVSQIPEEEEEIQLADESPQEVESAEVTPEVSETTILQQLGEARLYAEQGLLDEAEVLYSAILDVDPRHTEALMGMEAVRKQREEMSVPDATPSVFQKLATVGSVLAPARDQGKRDHVSASSKSRASEDPKVHLELGMAYKELGLLDECIAEFHISAEDPALAFISHRELGSCFLQKGDPEQATTHIQKALDCPGGSQEELLEVRYQLARVLEQRGMNEEALMAYRDIEDKDPAFRDVKERVQSLSQ